MHTIPVEDIVINFPWGHLAAKWWGSKFIRPIIVVHGWQDNAGSFDTLIPLLPSNLSYLAIDLPGHGLSSRIPDGMIYNNSDNIFILNEIRILYKWKKISLMGHSMGSILSFLYAAIFPDNIDLVIALDTLKPQVRSAKYTANVIQYRCGNTVIADQRNRDKLSLPPLYTYDELIERVHQGSMQSVDLIKAKYLLVRSTKQSSTLPTKLHFTRDLRIKYMHGWYLEQSVCLELITRIKAAYLFVSATDKMFREHSKNIREAINTFRKHNPRFEMINVPGTHHVHLNHPELIAATVSKFLQKHRFETNESRETSSADFKSKL